MGRTQWRKSPSEWHVTSKTWQEDLSLTFLLCLLSLAAFLGRGKGRLGYICLLGMVWGGGDLVGKRTVNLQSLQLSMKKQFFL